MSHDTKKLSKILAQIEGYLSILSSFTKDAKVNLNDIEQTKILSKEVCYQSTTLLSAAKAKYNMFESWLHSSQKKVETSLHKEEVYCKATFKERMNNFFKEGTEKHNKFVTLYLDDHATLYEKIYTKQKSQKMYAQIEKYQRNMCDSFCTTWDSFTTSANTEIENVQTLGRHNENIITHAKDNFMKKLILAHQS